MPRPYDPTNPISVRAKKQYDQRLALGVCPRCGSERDSSLLHCRDCSAYQREHSPYAGTPRRERVTPEQTRARIQAYNRNYRESLRREAIQSYGGRCSCCGTEHLIFLQLDHINDDGGAHRQALGTRGSFAFYRTIKNQGYPPGLQVLCANCHQAKTQKDPCPCRVAVD